MKILFIIGKGGVGKSSLSALCGLHLSQKNKKVLITSLDPAHNLADIFDSGSAEKSIKITDSLSILETNQEKWVKSYLKEKENQFSKAYSYLTSFSLEKHFSVLQYAPGIEEYALIRAFDYTLKNNPGCDFFIFDMPPTALTLKFFALAEISLLWLEKLFELRGAIRKKNEIISKIRLGNIELERDRVMQNIQQQLEFWHNIDRIFKDSALNLPILVVNPDKLSVMEGERIKIKLKTLKMPDPLMAVNKIKDYSIVHDENTLNLPVFENLTGIRNLTSAMDQINFTILDNSLL